MLKHFHILVEHLTNMEGCLANNSGLLPIVNLCFLGIYKNLFTFPNTPQSCDSDDEYPDRYAHVWLSTGIQPFANPFAFSSKQLTRPSQSALQYVLRSFLSCRLPFLVVCYPDFSDNLCSSIHLAAWLMMEKMLTQ